MRSFSARLLAIIMFLLPASLIWSCSKDDDGGADTQRDSILVYILSDPEYVFGFSAQARYSYCPSTMLQPDGSVHIFFCGNPNQGIMVDNIFHIQTFLTGKRTDAVSVLQPSLSWDSHHTCDPSVIEGIFKMDGVTYKYAMFYLSNPQEFYYNEIGVAFSNDLNSTTWVKYPYQIVKKTWAGDGDYAIGNGKAWGVGQPSAVSIDKKGQVLLTYTIGDIDGTRVVLTELDMSDMSDIKVLKERTAISTSGLLMQNGEQDICCDADIAINLDKNIVVMVRPAGPYPSSYPSYISSVVSVDCMPLDQFRSGIGTWTNMAYIYKDISQFPRNHNPGILRDNFGYIDDWENPTVYYTVSKESPDVAPSTGKHAEWTYHIYKISLTKKYRYFDKPVQKLSENQIASSMK